MTRLVVAASLLAAGSTQHLPGAFQHLEPTLHHYGYFAVAGALFFEDFGVPLPGETVLIAAATYAGIGHLNIWLVAVVGFAAAVLGDNVGFAIGHYGGRALLDRFGKYVLLTESRIDRAEAFFREHGNWIVVVARFIEGLRQANGLVAGVVEMPWLRFLAANLLGAALWVATWVSLGYFAGNHVETVAKYATYVGVAVLVVIVAVVARHVLRWRRRRAARPQ